MSAPALRPSEQRSPTPSSRWLDADGPDPALRLVRPPAVIRRVAGMLAVMFPLLAFLLLAVPWQQSALGTGGVIAYAPAERQQAVESPLKGRVETWHVTEGALVEAGEKLVTVVDNDPSRQLRLETQLDALDGQLRAIDEQIRNYGAKRDAEVAGRAAVGAEYDAKIASLRQKRVGERAEAETEALQLDRIKVLEAEGLESRRKLEVARAKANKAQSSVDARDAEINSLRRAREKALAEADAKIAAVTAELEAARAKRAEVVQKQQEVASKLAVQQSRDVRAPRAGRVLRLFGAPEGGQVKEGSPLLVLVPDTDARAVEIYVDGNDMPLVRQGEEARIQFEGWPAIQWVGMPGGGTGTFPGRVAFIDATDNGKGKFRVVIVPDGEWPKPDLLRQGVRAKGWIMLGQVSLGWELWRQINGFPPLPPVDKGEKVTLPSNKKPRAPAELK